MKLHTLLFIAIAAFSAQSASATVTLQFGQTGVARATGFGNAAGTPTNGMRWGIVIDSANDGFGAGNYDVFDQNTSGFLKLSGADDDDYYVTTGLSTVSATATGTDAAVSAGAITQLSNILGPTFPSGVTSGDAFRIIWFDGAPASGSFYGMLGNTGTTAPFVIPSDGNTQSFADFFVGNDPNKQANLQFPGGTVIPEPSRMMLLGFGLVGFFYRRRR